MRVFPKLFAGFPMYVAAVAGQVIILTAVVSIVIFDTISGYALSKD